MDRVSGELAFETRRLYLLGDDIDMGGDGALIATAYIAYAHISPHAEDAAPSAAAVLASDFLGQVSAGCEAYANGGLREFASAEYVADAYTGIAKRCRFIRFIYRLNYSVTFSSEEYVSVLARASLERGGRRLGGGLAAWIFTPYGICPPGMLGVRGALGRSALAVTLGTDGRPEVWRSAGNSGDYVCEPIVTRAERRNALRAARKAGEQNGK